MPPREAMSTGMPVILAGFLGLEPIARDSMAFPLGFSLTPASGYGVGPKQPQLGKWAHVEVGEVARAMVAAREDPAGRDCKVRCVCL